MGVSFSDLNFPSLSIVSHLLMEDVGWEGPKVLRLQGVSWTTQSAVASPHPPTHSLLLPSQGTQLLLNDCCLPTGKRQFGPHEFTSTVDTSTRTTTYLGTPLAPSHFETS